MSGAPLRKRMFEQAAARPRDGGFLLVLDAKPVQTPAGRPLTVPAGALGRALAREWNALGDIIDPLALPLTRLANTAIDGTAPNRAAVTGDLMRLAHSDLLCYRAEAPAGLVRRQKESWDPLIAWALETFDADLAVTSGILPVAQTPAALAALGRAIERFDDFALTAVHLVAALTGSLILALALAEGRLDAQGAFAAAHLDETWQAEQWGSDGEAAARLAGRAAELADAARFLELLKP